MHNASNRRSSPTVSAPQRPTAEGVILVILWLSVLAAAGCNKRVEPSAALETPEERAQLIKESFSNDGPAPSVDEGVDAFFEGFVRVFSGADDRDIKDFFDFSAMARNMENLGFIDAEVRRKLDNPLLQSVLGSKLFASPETHWQTHEIRRVTPLATSNLAHGSPSGDAARSRHNELLVMSLHTLSDGYRRMMRWWLIRSDNGPWKAYDFEFVSDAIRQSSHLGLALSGAKSKAPWIQHALRLNRELAPAMVAMDLEAARRVIPTIDETKLPPIFRRQFLSLRATLEMVEGDFEKCLATVRSAREAHPNDPDTPTLLYTEMSVLRLLERYDEAHAAVTKHVDIYGTDEDVQGVLGDIYRNQNRPEEAADAYRKGLSIHADCVGCLEGLIRTNQATPSELRGHLGRHSKLDDALDELSATYIADSDGQSLRALIAALEAFAPTHAALPRLRTALTSLEAPPAP